MAAKPDTPNICPRPPARPYHPDCGERPVPEYEKMQGSLCKIFETFGNEIAVQIDVPVMEIRAVYPKVTDAIESLR